MPYDPSLFSPEGDIGLYNQLYATDPNQNQSWDEFMSGVLGLPTGGYGFDNLWMPGVMSGIQSASDEPMVTNNETGQVIPLSEALMLTGGDWGQFDQAAQAYQTSYQNGVYTPTASQANSNAGDIDPNEALAGGDASASNVPVPSTTPSADSTQAQWPRWVAGLAGVGTLGVGLAGVIQKAMGGDTQARTTLQREIAQASPQEKQAIQSAIQGLQTVQNFTLGSPAGLLSRLGQRAPAEEQAWQQGLQGTQQNAQYLQSALYGQPQPAPLMRPEAGQQAGRTMQQTPFQRRAGVAPTQPQMAPVGAPQAPQTGYGQGLLPGMVSGTGQVMQGQEALLQAMLPMGEQLARGELPITPEMRSLVDSVFANSAGDLFTSGIENVRQRGFAGGADLLNSGPSGAVIGPALAQLQGQKAGALLNLGQQIPQLATQMAGAYSTPAALRLQGMGNLMNLNQNIVGQLGQYGQQGIANQTDFLRAATSPLSASGNIGTQLGNQRIGSGNQTQTQTTPYSLLDSFAPLASLMGGAGGLMTGLSGTYGNLSGTR